MRLRLLQNQAPRYVPRAIVTPRRLQVRQGANVLRCTSEMEGAMGEPKVMVAPCDPGSVEGLVTLACQLASGTGADVIALHVDEPLS